MMILFTKPYQGCKAGDRVTFEDKNEGRAVLEAEHGVEVRWDEEKQDYVEVVRITAEVSDVAGAVDA